MNPLVGGSFSFFVAALGMFPRLQKQHERATHKPQTKGASEFKRLMASLKRCPDTKREFFQQTVKPHFFKALIGTAKEAAEKVPFASQAPLNG